MKLCRARIIQVKRDPLHPFYRLSINPSVRTRSGTIGDKVNDLVLLTSLTQVWSHLLQVNKERLELTRLGEDEEKINKKREWIKNSIEAGTLLTHFDGVTHILRTGDRVVTSTRG